MDNYLKLADSSFLILLLLREINAIVDKLIQILMHALCTTTTRATQTDI